MSHRSSPWISVCCLYLKSLSIEIPVLSWATVPVSASLQVPCGCREGSWNLLDAVGILVRLSKNCIPHLGEISSWGIVTEMISFVWIIKLCHNREEKKMKLTVRNCFDVHLPWSDWKVLVVTLSVGAFLHLLGLWHLFLPESLLEH